MDDDNDGKGDKDPEEQSTVRSHLNHKHTEPNDE